MNKKQALLVVDVQNDFCQGGALAVPEGEKVVPVLNKYIDYFSDKELPVFFSRDWHPVETKHFKKYGGLWPSHCVQQTWGAEFHPDLKVPQEGLVVFKGMSPEKDAYSDFEAYDAKGREFAQVLEERGIKDLFVGGLATDYCVKFSVLDALRLGFGVYLLMDAMKGVNLKPEDSSKAIEEMVSRGAKKISFVELSQGPEAHDGLS